MKIPPLFRQASRFAVVGALATATHVTMALGANTLLKLSPLAANLVGYVCAVLVSYFGNARWSFEKTRDWGQFARFIVMSLAGLALNQAITWVATGPLGLPFWLALGVVVVVVPAVSFVVARIWVFEAR